MVYRSGPLIEGVVSPTATSTVRKNALEGGNPVASGGYTQGLRDPGTIGDAYAYQLALANRNNLDQTVGQAIGDVSYQATEAGHADRMTAAGWTRNPDGTWTHASTGKVTDAGGQTLLSDGGPNTGGVLAPPVDETGMRKNPDGTEGPPGLGQVSREAIEAQISALSAQYGLDLESLAALGGQIGAQAKFLLAQLQQDEQYAQEGLTGNLVGRGVYRSGITARDTGRLQGKFANQRAQVEMNKSQQLRQLAERAGLAKVGLARGKADVISQIDAGNLNAELRQALLDELNTLRPDDVKNVLGANALPTAIGGLGIAQ